MHIFQEVLFFKLRTTLKQKNKQFNLSCVSWMWEAQSVSQSRSTFLLPASHIQLTQDKLNQLFVDLRFHRACLLWRHFVKCCELLVDGEVVDICQPQKMTEFQTLDCLGCGAVSARHRVHYE